MDSKKVEVVCECEGTGYIAVADREGEDTNYFECAAHNAAYQDAPSVDELIAHLGKQTGINL